MVPTFSGKITNGKLFFNNRQQFDLYIGSQKDGEYTVIVKKIKQQRTSGKQYEKSNQLGYFWAVIIPILGNYFGYLPEEMNNALKFKFMRTGGSDDFPQIGSFSDLDTGKFEEKMEEIRIWALTEHNVNVPTVGDYYFNEEVN